MLKLANLFYLFNGQILTETSLETYRYQEVDSDEVFISSNLNCESSAPKQSCDFGNITSSTLYTTALEDYKTLEYIGISSQDSSATNMGKCLKTGLNGAFDAEEFDIVKEIVEK